MGNRRNPQFLLPFIAALGLICSTRATEVPQAKELANYTETISGSTITFEMVAIPGGSFMVGSPDSEEGRKEDEGPVHKVTVGPFWMGKTEVTWDEYEQYYFRGPGESAASKADAAIR
jgi:formylglycine-generating enzyme required for sulfatase activity